MKCRHCQTELEHCFIDMGFAPPSNAYLSESDLRKPESYYPLKLFVCDNCWLVQTEDFVEADELFSHDYAYFSSVSQGWLDHAKSYVAMITERLGLDEHSHVIEVAANDGYLLKNFVETGIPCLGIEPTESTARVAENLGIPILGEFFGKQLGEQIATEGKQADLIIGNNVYAHVPDINDFTAGLKAALKPGGTITLEFPHLLQLIKHTQFDTVYHEHFSYLSLFTVMQIFSKAGLRIRYVEELPTHGGSLRVYGCHVEDEREESQSVSSILRKEKEFGLQAISTYQHFQLKVNKVKNDFLVFLTEQKLQGKKVAAYGAAAKGNTLLNYAGVKPDLLSFVCDAAQSKQGKFLPGSHIPVLQPSVLGEEQPDYVLILPWNLKDEVMEKLEYIRDWSGKYVVIIPALEVI